MVVARITGGGVMYGKDGGSWPWILEILEIEETVLATVVVIG